MVAALGVLSSGCLDWDALSQLGSTLAVAHLPKAGQFAGTADLTLMSGIIDTSVPEIRGSMLPMGVTLDVWAHEPFGPELAVLHVRGLTVPSGQVVRVQGTRPLVVVASTDIEVTGVLDAGGKGTTPGAGAALMRGVGANGRSAANESAGGGGAGFGEQGAAGSHSSSTLGGEGGAAYGDEELTVLTGGSNGGIGWYNICAPRPGGAGGGALQLFAAGAIRVRDGGGINAGGGGGLGGEICATAAGGSGGGSGGALFLQASEVVVRGAVSANGGGGGGGTSGCGGIEESGLPGADGTLGAAPALGGPSVGCGSKGGGSGGSSQAAAAPGQGGTGGSPGGGGGGFGRIRVVSQKPALLDGVVSPKPSLAVGG